MKKINKLYFQIIPIILFVLIIINFILNANDYSLIMFKQTGESLGFLLITLIIIYEIIYLVVTSIKFKKLIKLLFLIPYILAFLFSGFAYLFTAETNYQKIKIDELKETIVITNHSFLFSGESTIYQKVNFLTGKKITIVDGNNGSKPLSDPEFYTIKVEDNKLLFEYYAGKQLVLTLEHNGDTFIVKGIEEVK